MLKRIIIILPMLLVAIFLVNHFNKNDVRSETAQNQNGIQDESSKIPEDQLDDYQIPGFEIPDIEEKIKKNLRNIKEEIGKGSPQDLEPVPVKIISTSGEVKNLSLQIADTEEESKKGLMFVKAMPQDGGMLFVLDKPQTTSIWMKNTLIPLDVLFIDENKKIVKIHKKAIPHDLTPIPSEHKVKYIIELNEGTVFRLRISVGDTIEY